MVLMSQNKLDAYFRAESGRKLMLRRFIALKFDVSNQNQIEQIQKYLNEFDYICNQMYLFQGLSEGVSGGFAAIIASAILPLPQFVSVAATYAFYTGLGAYILGQFRMHEFDDRLQEMKQIYNWCLKQSQSTYISGGNDDILVNPTIRRLIKTLAPFCDTQFMIAWPIQDRENQEQGNIGLWGSASYAYNRFSCWRSGKDYHRNIVDTQKFKRAVEKRQFDINVLQGFEQSINYFMKSPEFRAILASKIPSFDDVRGALPFKF